MGVGAEAGGEGGGDVEVCGLEVEQLDGMYISFEGKDKALSVR